MGKCTKESVKIQEYLDKLMDAKKRGLLYYDLRLEKHLEECEDCRQKFQEDQQLFAAIDNLKSFEPPVDFTAQLMKKVALTENYPVRQPIALWSSLAIIIFALISTAALAGGGLWLWGNEKVSSYLLALINPVLEKAGLAIYAVGDFYSSLLSLLSSSVQLIRLIIEVFPITSFCIILIPLVALPIVVKLINQFQHENYA